MSMVKAKEWVRQFNEEYHGMDIQDYEQNKWITNLVRQIQFDAALSDKEDLRQLTSDIASHDE